MLKIAIIGAGSRGVECFGRLVSQRNDCVINAICDINEVRGKAAGEQFNCSNVFTSLEAMLQYEIPDAAIITTPDAEHEACAVTLLNAGVNVLIDKPLSPKLQGCKNIIAAMEKSGKIAVMGFNLRHVPTLKRLKEIIAAGTLGRVILLENREFYEGGKTYMARWNGKKSLSGGLWIHKGSHDFDVFNWLLGFPKPRKVSAFAGMSVFLPDNLPFTPEAGVAPGPGCSGCHYGKNGSNVCPDCVTHDEKFWGEEAQKIDGYRKDSCMYCSDLSCHDNGFAIVEYENGVRASHMECFVTGLNDRRYTIVGTEAIALVSLTDRTIRVINRRNKEHITYSIPVVEGGHGGADPGLLTGFIDAIKGKPGLKASLYEGMLSTAIAEAAELSKEEEKTVFIEL